MTQSWSKPTRVSGKAWKKIQGRMKRETTDRQVMHCASRKTRRRLVRVVEIRVSISASWAAPPGHPRPEETAPGEAVNKPSDGLEVAGKGIQGHAKQAGEPAQHSHEEDCTPCGKIVRMPDEECCRHHHAEEQAAKLLELGHNDCGQYPLSGNMTDMRDIYRFEGFTSQVD